MKTKKFNLVIIAAMIVFFVIPTDVFATNIVVDDAPIVEILLIITGLIMGPISRILLALALALAAITYAINFMRGFYASLSVIIGIGLLMSIDWILDAANVGALL